MKQNLLTLAICILFINCSFSQTNFSPFLSKEEQQIKYKINSFINELKKLESLDKKNKNNAESTSKAKEDSLKSSISSYVDTLNATKPFEINSSLGINSVEDLKNSFGSLSVSARFRISKYKTKPTGQNKNPKSLDPHYVYFEYKTRTALSTDTNTFVKTFLFPQLNKQDYVFGYYHQITNSHNWDFWLPIFEFSLNKYSDKDNKNYFTSEAFQLGVRIHKSFPSTTETETGSRWVMFMPYYKLINVDPKYKSSYNLLLGETSLPLTFRCVGMEMAFGPQNAAFFCNMNYILNKDDGIKSPELIRFVYTVGVRALFSSNTFRIF